ncbi:MAG: 4Fe-4S dicluster domain-containing protein [Bacillota bacterium]
MISYNLTESLRVNDDFRTLVGKLSGQPLSQCYQCGKCTAGCPVSFAMDVVPNRVIRMVQAGLKDEVLRCQSIWICATCSTCTARCPEGVDPARVMEVLRIMAGKEGIPAPGRGKDVSIFNRIFLKSVRSNGRMFEAGTMAGFNVKSLHLLREASTGMHMFIKGKLKLLPEKIRNRKEIDNIFEAVVRERGTGL